MEVTQEMVDKLSKLARLNIESEQKENLQKDMQKLIGFIEKLQELDTHGIEPLQHISTEMNKFRADNVIPSMTHEQALQNADLKDEHFFLVPKMIKK